MALTVGDREIRPLTADEVLRMVDAGILQAEERVELLHGALTDVSPKSPEHAAVTARLVEWLSPGVADRRFALRAGDPLVVPDATSLPEPDIAVVDHRLDPHRHPTTALLVIEVAVTSVRTDTQIKPALYAAAGVPEYWVVNVPARRLVVYEDPRASAYGATRTLDETQAVEPRRVAAPPLVLRSLLAGV